MRVVIVIRIIWNKRYFNFIWKISSFNFYCQDISKNSSASTAANNNYIFVGILFPISSDIR